MQVNEGFQCPNFLHILHVLMLLGLSFIWSLFILFVVPGGLDEPIQRPYVKRDWRFGHYQMDGLQDPLSRLSRLIWQPFSPIKKRKPQKDDDELVVEPLLY